MMLNHPPTYNVTLRPHYMDITRPAGSESLMYAAACLLDYLENAKPLEWDGGWIEASHSTLYDTLSPFVAQKPVRDALNWLEAQGLIESRHDPNFPMKRTKQYRLVEDEIVRRIECWRIADPVNYARRCILPNSAQYQNMHDIGGEDVDKVRTRGNGNNSLIPEKLNIGSDYKTTMRLLIPMLSIEVFPVTGKSPSLKAVNGTAWEWSRKRLGRPGVQPATFHAWQVATGYGMIPIKGERLVFVDVDRDTFDAELLIAIPRLATTYRQSRGTHCCYAIRLPMELDGRWEIDDTEGEIASIRNHNSYQVGAGSLHPSGERYTCNMQPPIDLSDTEAQTLFGLFEARKASKGKRTATVSTSVQPIRHVAMPDKMANRLKAWATAGMAKALQQLGATNKGAFNKTLYKTAFRLAALAAYSGDSNERLIDMLWSVCEGAGYVRRDGQSQTAATIRSGLVAGRGAEVRLPKFTERVR